MLLFYFGLLVYGSIWFYWLYLETQISQCPHKLEQHKFKSHYFLCLWCCIVSYIFNIPIMVHTTQHMNNG